MPFTDPPINNARFYYELAGAGLPVVLLHAGIADSRMWDAQFAALAEHYRVLRYDLRGYGQTTVAPRDGLTPITTTCAPCSISLTSSARC